MAHRSCGSLHSFTCMCQTANTLVHIKCPTMVTLSYQCHVSPSAQSGQLQSAAMAVTSHPESSAQPNAHTFMDSAAKPQCGKCAEKAFPLRPRTGLWHVLTTIRTCRHDRLCTIHTNYVWCHFHNKTRQRSNFICVLYSAELCLQVQVEHFPKLLISLIMKSGSEIT